jgi:hypothetical protein
MLPTTPIAWPPHEVQELQLAQIQREGPAPVDPAPETLEQVIEASHVEFPEEPKTAV